MDENRRYYRRQAVVCRVDYVDTRGRADLGLIQNVSIDGMFIDHVSGLRSGDVITTTFVLPGSPPFKLKARVVRVVSRGVGLKFEGLSRRDPRRHPEALKTCSAALYRSWLSHAGPLRSKQNEFVVSLEPVEIG